MADLRFDKVLTNNRYSITISVVNTTASEDELIEDFGEPVVTFGGDFDVTTTANPLSVSSIVGTFVVGETVTGGTSGATGVVNKIDLLNDIIWVTTDTGITPVETITGGTSGATAQVDSVGTAKTTFELAYGSAPNSTANFSTTEVSRRLISGLPITFNFDGNTNTEAKENCLDHAIATEFDVKAAWNLLLAKIDDYEGVDIIPL